MLLERWALYDPATTAVDLVFRAITTVADVLLEEDEQSSVTGCVILGDSACLSLPHVVALTPTPARKAMVLWQVGEAEPERPPLRNPYKDVLIEMYQRCVMRNMIKRG